MYSSEDLEKLWFLYKLEGQPKNLSIESFCLQHGVSYQTFYNWFYSRKKAIVPVEIVGLPQVAPSYEENESEGTVSMPETISKTGMPIESNACTPVMAYRNDGRYCIDNSIAERSIRTLTIERKNIMAFGSHQGAETSTIYHTFVETCKMGTLSFYQFLKNYSTAIMEGRTDFENLTPAILGKID